MAVSGARSRRVRDEPRGAAQRAPSTAQAPPRRLKLGDSAQGAHDQSLMLSSLQ